MAALRERHPSPSRIGIGFTVSSVKSIIIGHRDRLVGCRLPRDGSHIFGDSMKRVRRLSTIAFALPLSLGAQQPTPNPITESMIGFGYYGGWLIAAFDSIPASQYGFRPTPAQMTVGFIAQHLEDANYQLCARFSGRSREVTSKDSLPETVKAAWPKDTLVARLRASLRFCGDAMETLTDANLGDELSATATLRQAPRARWVLLFLTDLADHYSQIANYMRILGMVPPSAVPAPPPPDPLSLAPTSRRAATRSTRRPVVAVTASTPVV
jgi:hypothetical protein